MSEPGSGLAGPTACTPDSLGALGMVPQLVHVLRVGSIGAQQAARTADPWINSDEGSYVFLLVYGDGDVKNARSIIYLGRNSVRLGLGCREAQGEATITD